VLDQRDIVAILKAAAEPTRLRILLLLEPGELNVKDLTRILGQSQPRISRHLKLLAEAGLIERLADGSWAFYQLVNHGPAGDLLRHVLEAVAPGDATFERDRKRAESVKRERETAAQAYFQAHAAEWDRIRALHVTESEVEAALLAAVGSRRARLLVDLGTGTGRVLELLAPCYERGLGFDVNHSMLAYARGKLDAAGLRNASVRHGDIYDLPLADGCADVVVMHQLLHFLSEPALAVREAARTLTRHGRLVIIDFAPHTMEFLREAFAHERLGFSDAQVGQWLDECDLELETTRRLVPAGEAASGKLTVTIWTAVPRGAGERTARIETSKVEA
jgi:ArsR family transcriptional regulator